MTLISLPETKNYLRVDHCEDDKLILTLIDTAQRLVMDVGRMNEKQLVENEETLAGRLTSSRIVRQLIREGCCRA